MFSSAIKVDAFDTKIGARFNRLAQEVGVRLYGLWFDLGPRFLLEPFFGKIFEPERIILAVITDVKGSLIILKSQSNQKPLCFII